MNECDYMSDIKKHIRNITNNIYVPQDTPTPDEQAAFAAYKNGDPDYQPSISQEELMKELNIK